MTRGAMLFGALLAMASVSGCASTEETYCSSLEDDQPKLSEFAQSSDNPDADLFADSLAVFTELRNGSPDDVRDEWDTFVFAWEGVADAFDGAGIDPQAYQPGEKPPGVTDGQVQAIEDAAAELGSARVQGAGRGIEQHARDVCRVDLGL